MKKGAWHIGEQKKAVKQFLVDLEKYLYTAHKDSYLGRVWKKKTPVKTGSIPKGFAQ